MARCCAATKTNSMEKMVDFRIFAPMAKKVYLAGCFNSWKANSISAKKDAKGNWTAKINLHPGKYEYRFIVDGNWVNDPNCKNFSSNNLGSQNCIMEVK